MCGSTMSFSCPSGVIAVLGLGARRGLSGECNSFMFRSNTWFSYQDSLPWRARWLALSWLQCEGGTRARDTPVPVRPFGRCAQPRYYCIAAGLVWPPLPDSKAHNPLCVCTTGMGVPAGCSAWPARRCHDLCRCSIPTLGARPTEAVPPASGLEGWNERKTTQEHRKGEEDGGGGEGEHPAPGPPGSWAGRQGGSGRGGNTTTAERPEEWQNSSLGSVVLIRVSPLLTDPLPPLPPCSREALIKAH